MATLLVVEDDRNMRLLTAARLKDYYTVLTACDGEEALKIIYKGGVDLIISDIMMPNMDGYELLKTLREDCLQIPFLFLTAKETSNDMEKGFDLGTDDYMTKPFSSDELLWRVKALLRRANINQEKKIKFGRITIDSEEYAVYSDDEYVEFPKKEFDLLFKLLSYPEQIFSKEQILNSVWGITSESGEETIKTHISRIRNKLKNMPELNIQTIKGLGYRASFQDSSSI